jgi:hypothetical protein
VNVAADPENQAPLADELVADGVRSRARQPALCGGASRPDAGGVELENKDALTTNRRTLYYSSYPEAGGKSALGELFDAPDPLDCYRRASSIVPQQALALTNSDLVHQSSVAIVKAWQESPGSAADASVDATDRFIDDLFAQVLSRGHRARKSASAAKPSTVNSNWRRTRNPPQRSPRPARASRESCSITTTL